MLDTRLRFLRRAVEAAIIVVGFALALAQFTSLDRLAATVLASSAIAAAVVGFASRQVLANAIAGMVLAVTQPLRIGDLVTFEGETGTVEDVSLTYTWLRTGSDARLIIPNERLAAGVLRNDSIRSATVALEVSAVAGARRRRDDGPGGDRGRAGDAGRAHRRGHRRRDPRAGGGAAGGAFRAPDARRRASGRGPAGTAPGRVSGVS